MNASQVKYSRTRGEDRLSLRFVTGSVSKQRLLFDSSREAVSNAYSRVDPNREHAQSLAGCVIY